VVAVLREREIPFAVIGAAAMAVHGIARATRDLDLLTRDARSLVRATWAALEQQRITVDIRIGDADDPLAGVVRFAEAGVAVVDVVVGRAGWQAAIVDRAVSRTIEGVNVPVALAADLIALKLYAGSTQDLWDVQQLLDVGDRVTLVAQVEPMLASLPEDARRLWARVAGPR
jgi:predicted nucleotidyltransferase